MNYDEREAIFSKEVLNISDIMALYGKNYDCSSKILRDIKMECRIKRGALRLELEGVIHILDYFFVMGIDPKDPGTRYTKRKKFEDDGARSERARRSVCM